MIPEVDIHIASQQLASLTSLLLHLRRLPLRPDRQQVGLIGIERESGKSGIPLHHPANGIARSARSVHRAWRNAARSARASAPAAGSVSCTERAMQTFRAALTLDPHAGAARENLARALADAGRADEASGEYEALRRAAPSEAQGP